MQPMLSCPVVGVIQRPGRAPRPAFHRFAALWRLHAARRLCLCLGVQDPAACDAGHARAVQLEATHPLLSSWRAHARLHLCSALASVQPHLFRRKRRAMPMSEPPGRVQRHIAVAQARWYVL